MELVRTGVARTQTSFFSGSRETAAPHMRPQKRVATWCAAVSHATDVSAGKLAHDSLSPRRVRRTKASTGGA